MSNAPTPFIGHGALLPLLLSRLGVPVTSSNKSLPSPPDSMDTVLRGDLNPNKYTKFGGGADYIKAVDNSIKMLVGAYLCLQPAICLTSVGSDFRLPHLLLQMF